jgi:hypothetical protein
MRDAFRRHKTAIPAGWQDGFGKTAWQGRIAVRKGLPVLS